MAAKLPGRTDNEIKNVWHTRIKKKLKNYQFPGDSKRPKIIESVPRLENPNLFNRKEVDSFGYGSILSRSSSSEVLSAVTYSPVITTPDIVNQEKSNCSKNTFSETRERFCSADRQADQDLKVWFEMDQELKCVESDDSKHFWYNLFIKAEGLQDLPGF